MLHDDNFRNIAQREKGLRHTLNARQLMMIAIGGAIGTGLFLGSSFAISMAGPSVLISYAIGAVIALLLMGCLAEMTAAHPTTGSFGAYAEHYVSPWAGFLVRYAYCVSNVLVVGTEATAIAVYMKYWFPAAPGWMWIIGFSFALVFANSRNVKVFGFIEYWFSVIKISAIVVFVVVGAYVVFADPSMVMGEHAGAEASVASFSHYVDDGGFFPGGVWGMWIAAIISIFSYLGIEMIAVASGEADDPERAVTRAFRSTVARLVLFYLITLALILAIVPWNAAGHGQSPFVKVLLAIHLPAAAGVMNFVVLIAALSAMNSQVYVATRMIFSLARAGYVPSRLGGINDHGIPLRALLLSTTGIAVATIVNVLWPNTSFMIMMSVAMFGAMFTWMMIFVTHYFFRRRWVASGRPAPRFRMAGFPTLTIFGAMMMLAFMVTTFFTPPFHMTLIFGIPFLSVLTVLYFTRQHRLAKTKVDFG